MTQFTRGAAGASVLAILMALPGLAQAQDDLTLKVGGRVQIDYTLADLDGPDGEIDGNELRRARLNVSGKYGDAVKYKFEVNTNSSQEINVEDAYIQFAPANWKVKIKVGQFKTHNSLDEQTSSRFISTLERAAFTDAFAFDRRIGASIGTSGDNYTFDIGVFGENLEGGEFDKDGKAAAARLTYNPVKTDDMLVHLGASWRYTDAGENEDGTDGLKRYRQRPFTHNTGNRIISTPRFADSDNFFGAEAAIVKGPFWAAGEYGVLSADGDGGAPDGDFDGYYAEAGIFFGGKRTYKGGKFDRPKIYKSINEGGYGALSLVARYDAINLDDAPYLGELDSFILGADWYPTKYTRLGLNAFEADATNGAADKATGVVGRLQFDF